MKIRDIVNHDIVNLTNCDQEPIHVPGSIQPHGFLFALDTSLIIEYCSGNLEAYTGITYHQVLGKNIAEITGIAQQENLANYILDLKEGVSAPLMIVIGDKQYNCAIHKSDQLWVAEFEPLSNSQPGLATVYDQTVQFVKYMQDAVSLQQLCDSVGREIRALTGYDRVMVYRFDKDYNGEVYAESKREDLESFLGLHYPHTDIPVQARLLYIRNLLRIIVDVNYTPVPIYTIDDGKEKNVDLSLSVLRSTSPIHVQYLHNMGVGATLTISLLHEGKLWGLIACHHYSAKYIDHYTRINSQLQGHFLTSQISIRQMAEEYDIARKVNNALENMLSQAFVPERGSFINIIVQPSLLSLCNAEGVAIILDGLVYKNGKTPSDMQVQELAGWAGPFCRHHYYTSSKLVDDFAGAAAYCNLASGIIFYTLRSFNDACIMWFNPETLEEVTWAGDPSKAIEKNANGLSPRKSFESWKVIIKGQAREWAAPELTAAANYAHALQKHVTLVVLHEEEKRQRYLSEQLKSSNEELENINWISSHDLREPLRKIRMFSSRLLQNEAELSKSAEQTIHKMSHSAERMQHLIESLTSYAKTRQSANNFEAIDLQEKVTQIVQEIKEDSLHKNAGILVRDLPVIRGIPVLVQQLFINLVNNALKFAKKDVEIKIDIYKTATPARHPKSGDQRFFDEVIVRDNGIGFDEAMKEDIFKVFTRLNPVHDYEGSGIGLALCKKIMQLHQGYIEAENNEDGGASFHLYFPQ